MKALRFPSLYGEKGEFVSLKELGDIANMEYLRLWEVFNSFDFNVLRNLDFTVYPLVDNFEVVITARSGLWDFGQKSIRVNGRLINEPILVHREWGLLILDAVREGVVASAIVKELNHPQEAWAEGKQQKGSIPYAVGFNKDNQRVKKPQHLYYSDFLKR